MKIKFYGVRGSYPAPGPSTNKYGGNTTCVTFTNEVDGKIDRIIIDCGTGAVQLGEDIIANHSVGKEDLNIKMLFTHLHPDHTQGFPFFAPNYNSNCNMGLYGMESLKKNVGQILNLSMLPPTFPIEYKDLKSHRKHYIIKDGSVMVSLLRSMKIDVMQAYAPSHPQQGALYFKITDVANRKSVACIWDNESKFGGDKAVINFAKDCNIMIHDTQYTAKEYDSDKDVVQGFGHSTYEMAIEDAWQARIKDKLICTHFNPTHSDEKLDYIATEGIKLIKIEHSDLITNDMDIILAHEGMEIEV